MEEFILGDLFRVKTISTAQLMQGSDDITFVYDHHTHKCDFVKPVVLVSTMAPLALSYADTQSEINRKQFYLLNASPEIISTKYLYYYLRSHKATLDNLYMGSTIKNLALSDFLKIKISVPSMDEQYKVVRYLDVLDELIQDRRKGICKIDDVFSAYYERAAQVNSKYWTKKRLLSFSKMETLGQSGTFEITPKDNGVLVCLGKRVFLKVDRNVCNPYYLAAALKNSIVAKYTKTGYWTNVDYQDVSLSSLCELHVAIPTRKNEQSSFETIYKRIELIKDDMKRFEHKVTDLFDYMLFKLFCNDKDKSFFKAQEEVKMLSDSIIKYSYKQPYPFNSVVGYNEYRDDEFKKLSSGTHVQIFDETTGKIILMKS